MFRLDAMARLRFRRKHCDDPPSVLVNSLPKSGTHLLLQLVRAIPGLHYRGGFFASSPSLTQRLRGPAATTRKLGRILPGECIGAHLYHSDGAEAVVREKQFLSLFLCRDPRDVLMSELHYLTGMNRWHRMHRHFARLPEFGDRLKLALKGLDAGFPDCNQRFLAYAGWMHAPGTVVIRFEDLIGPSRGETCQRIVNEFGSWGMDFPDSEKVVRHMVQAADPQKSHTFRKGLSGGWSNGLTAAQVKTVETWLEPSIAAFGYD
ncbi:sulfotransferase domain-containing protein [Halocynthiibacter sp.]|uniref:sulfotransferase domain-containing protein n=1 Tax=Halocynthiibacter sp. TaxID=1979210 RepID=UPI003C5C5B4F